MKRPDPEVGKNYPFEWYGARCPFPRHAVWPTKAPPVGTAYWEAADHERFEAGFRPEGYSGGQFDQEAWDVWLKTTTDAHSQVEAVLHNRRLG